MQRSGGVTPRGRDEGECHGRGLNDEQEQDDGGASRARRRLNARARAGASPPDPKRSGRQYDTPTSFRCIQCAALKIKCSRTTPCERCFKLSLRCTPPTEAYLLSPAAALEKIGVASPRLELVLRSMDPAKLAQCYFSVFLDWLGHGRIDRGVALTTLQAHRARSRRLGVDYSYGAVDGMARALGLTSVDLEDPTELTYEAPPPLAADGGAGAGGGHIGSSSGSAASFAAEAAQLRAALEGSAIWRFVSGPGLAASASVCLSVPSGEHTVLLAKGTFLGAADIVRTRNARRIVGPLLYAGLISPEDWRSWFELDVSSTLTDSTQPCSRFLKVMEITGGIELYLLTCRRVFVEEAGVTCRLMTLEPMPASRHLCPIPSHPHRVVNTYRHTPTPSESLLEGVQAPAQAPAWMTAAGAGAGYGQRQVTPTIAHPLPCLPGLAALPVVSPHMQPAPDPAPPARNMERGAPPFNPATIQAGLQAMYSSTVASDLDAQEATGPLRGPPPPPSTAARAFVQLKQQEEESEDSDLLSAALDALDDGSDLPVFDGEEETMEAAWAQGWRGMA